MGRRIARRARAAGAGAATLLLALYGVAWAADMVVIGADSQADAGVVREGLFGISLGILMPCVQGRVEAGETPEAAESACFCEHRSEIEARLAPIRKVLARRSEWKGKVLEIRDGDDTLHIELENVDRMQEQIARCGGAS